MFEQLINHLKNTCSIRIIVELRHSSGNINVLGNFRGDLNTLMIYIDGLNELQYDKESVLFHELAHATGTVQRLNRFSIVCVQFQNRKDYYSKPESHIIEEIVAETVALKLMNHFGLYNQSLQIQSNNYITHHKYNLLSIDELDISRQVNEIFDYIMLNWLKGFEFNSQNKAA